MTLNPEKHHRTVVLHCPDCAGTEFETQESEGTARATCVSCGGEYDKEELSQQNSENIDSHVDEMADEVLADVEKEVDQMLRNAFRGSKNIRIK